MRSQLTYFLSTALASYAYKGDDDFHIIISYCRLKTKLSVCVFIKKAII